MSHKFLANVVLKGKIEILTGMHIGGSKEKLEIGGVDSPVIRDPNTEYPIIPGTSIKGKLRMLLEFSEGVVSSSGLPSSSTDVLNPISLLFGDTEKVQRGPSRLTFRDAYPDAKTVEMWNGLNTELQFTELKAENSIDRLTSEANPRFIERVVKGSKFDVQIVYAIYDYDGDNGENDKQNFNLLLKGLRLLEHSGLGGSVSRGYGQVQFEFALPIVVKSEDYKIGSDIYVQAAESVSDTDQLFTLHSEQITAFPIEI